MSRDANRELLQRYVREVWKEADPGAVARFAAADFRRHGPAGAEPLTRDQQIERLRDFRRAFPDIIIEVEDVVTDDDHIVFRSTMRGTHQEEFLGIPASGRRITVRLLDMIRVEDGRFAEQWGGPDMLDLLRQIGATVAPG